MLHAGRAATVATVATLCLALPSRAHALDARQDPPDGMRSEVGATALFVFGVAPATGVGLAPSLTLRWPSVSLCFEPRSLAIKSDQPSASGTKVLTIDSELGIVALCRHKGPVFACGLAQAGRVEAIPLAGLQPSDNVAWLLSSGARGGFEWPIFRYFRLHGFIELHVFLARPALEHFSTAWYAAPAGMIAGANLSLRDTSR
ncbi:hypothetical protein [Sorangium sp. So ce131]|uniref:hypothetical protein n=1 Tax=Sorangium sp. So ce131 TaxID=3133282 RepID=UPI003F62CCDD